MQASLQILSFAYLLPSCARGSRAPPKGVWGRGENGRIGCSSSVSAKPFHSLSTTLPAAYPPAHQDARTFDVRSRLSSRKEEGVLRRPAAQPQAPALCRPNKDQFSCSEPFGAVPLRGGGGLSGRHVASSCDCPVEVRVTVLSWA